MKKLLIAFFVCCCTFYINAQQIDSKISEVYGDKTQELVGNDPDRLKFLNDILLNRFKIEQQPLTAGDKYPKLSEMALLNKYNPALQRDVVFDPLTFNPLKYDLNFLPNTAAIYRVDNTDYIIVISPQTLTH